MFHSSSTKHHGLFRNQILHFSLLFLLANLKVEFLSEFFKNAFSEFLKRLTEQVHKMLLNKHATRDSLTYNFKGHCHSSFAVSRELLVKQETW